jgi:hypothetical protein
MGDPIRRLALTRPPISHQDWQLPRIRPWIPPESSVPAFIARLAGAPFSAPDFALPRRRIWVPPDASASSAAILNAMTMFPRTGDQPGPSWSARNAAWRVAMQAGTFTAPIGLIGAASRLYGVTAGPNISVVHGVSHDKAHGIGRSGQENIPQDDPGQFPTDF